MDNRHDENRPRPARQRRAGGLLMVLAIVVLVAACGQSSGDGGEGVASAKGKKTTSTTTKTDARQAGLDYARCMREHGVDIPDPTFDDEGKAVIGFQPGGGDVKEAPEAESGFPEADRACRHHLQGVLGNGPDGKPDAEMQDKALRFARCMRENGVTDFPDPDFSEGGMVRIGGEGLDPSSPTMQAAHKACQSILGPPPGAGDAVQIEGKP